MKTQMNKNLLAALLLAVGITGCGGSVDGGMSTVAPLPNPLAVTETAATEPSDTDSKPMHSAATEHSDTDGKPMHSAATEPSDTDSKPMHSAATEPGDADNKSVYSADAAPAEPKMDSVEAVAALGDLAGIYSSKHEYVPRCAVDCEDGHNPYDLVWSYGDPGKQSGAYGTPAARSWGSKYQGYVDACDWSLVFDADYYKKAFPVLAVLYHDDDALLLEHFQTRGVHEGRQASAAFNVSAYMENCSGDLRSAFGDSYECYYFYYMLNHGTEQGVGTRNEGGRYPMWRTVEMSELQSSELAMTNTLCKEAGNGAEPVEPDPELMALACYRAWNDSVNHVEGHDWVDYHTAEAYHMADLMSLEHGWSENTVKQYSTLSPKYSGQWINYKNSKSHYGAMIDPGHLYMGVSNVYIQPLHDDAGSVMTSEFEVYAAAHARAPESLD